jgi:hypothetical protein
MHPNEAFPNLQLRADRASISAERCKATNTTNTTKKM